MLGTTLALVAILTGARTASPQTITEFPIPTAGSNPTAIAAGPDDASWFTENEAAKIGRISWDGVITEFAVGGFPEGIAAGPDGNLWFTAYSSSRVVRMTPAGATTSFPFGFEPCTPPFCTTMGAITTGPDGNMWFTYGFIGTTGGLGRIAMDGSYVGLAPSSAYSFQPTHLVAGPDGAVWFTGELGNKIGRITPTGSLSEFPIPTPASAPGGIAVGPDGNLWFAETAVKQIGRITPSGTVTEFPSGSGFPVDVAAGPDDSIWFTASGDLSSGLSFVGRITMSGLVTEVQVPTPFAALRAIAGGRDGAMWFTEVANNIGRITTVGPARFNTVDPCRVIDTRDPDGPFGGPALAGRTVRSFKLTGRCGIPIGATAIAVNITITGPTAAGDLRVFPDRMSIPPTSSVNYVSGQTRANSAVIRLGYGGLAVYCDQAVGAAHLILDVTGYFD